MKSDSKEKKKQERRHKLLRLFYTEEYVRELEQKMDIANEDEQLEEPKWKKIVMAIMVIGIIIVVIVALNLYNNKNYLKKNENLLNENMQMEQIGPDDLEINSEELSKYMIDTLNGIYLKIAPTKLGDNVAYSLTYNYDILPKGYLHYEEYFTNEYMTTVLVNGYPYISAEEMGLETDEEAYMATQLAVYEVVSRRKIENLSKGTFSLSKIKASEDEYKEMVSRVVNKAEELVNNAMDNPYDNSYYAGLKTKEETSFDYDDQTKIGIMGPIYTYSDFTDEALRVVDKDYIPMSHFEIRNFTPENTTVAILDKDRNEVEEVPTGEDFYIKFTGGKEYCINIKISKTTQLLRSKIYYNDSSQKKYVVLGTYETNYTSMTYMNNEVDAGNLYLNFKNLDGEEIYGAKYYILNEQKEVIWNVNGFYVDDILLPVGKYYITEYEAPDNYLLNLNEYEVNIEKDGDEVTIEVVHDKLF